MPYIQQLTFILCLAFISNGLGSHAQSIPEIKPITFEGYVLEFSAAMPEGEMIDVQYFPPIISTLWRDSSRIPDFGQFYPRFDSIFPRLINSSNGLLTTNGTLASLRLLLAEADNLEGPHLAVFFDSMQVGRLDELVNFEFYDAESMPTYKVFGECRIFPKKQKGIWALYRVRLSGLSLEVTRNYRGTSLNNISEVFLVRGKDDFWECIGQGEVDLEDTEWNPKW